MENSATTSAKTSLPYFAVRSQDDDVYRGEEHWAVVDQEYQILADVEIGPGDEARAAYIVRACNSHEELLSACKAVVNGMPEEMIDTHLRNLLDRCERAIATATE